MFRAAPGGNMTTLMQNNPVKAVLTTRSLIWLVTMGILAALLAVLTQAVIDVTDRTQDIKTMNWAMDGLVGWDFWGVTTFFDVVSAVTGAKAGIVYGTLGITFLLLLGKTRPAIVFTVVGLTIAAVSVLGDATLGDFVDRGRPLDATPNPTPAFPSGHVFGSTVFFGFIGFLAVYYQMKSKIVIPLLLILGTLTVLVGPARVHVEAHYPSDVVAGYVLAALWLLVIIPVFIYIRGTTWMDAWKNKENSAIVA